MTDRIAYLTVVLERDNRDDDVEALAEAIRHMRGVASVENGKPVDSADYVARSRADVAWRERILSLLQIKEEQ